MAAIDGSGKASSPAIATILPSKKVRIVIFSVSYLLKGVPRVASSTIQSIHNQFELEEPGAEATPSTSVRVLRAGHFHY